MVEFPGLDGAEEVGEGGRVGVEDDVAVVGLPEFDQVSPDADLDAFAAGTVITGVVTALRIGLPPPPITCRGCRGPHIPADGTPDQAR
ncbi:hypothetical protein KPATCC21470_4171 [Kitasatospora purpeofusca]